MRVNNTQAIAALAARQDSMEAKLDAILAELRSGSAAKPVAVPARIMTREEFKAASEPKAEVKFRSAKAIASGKDQAKAIWDAAYAAAGVKRFADLSPAQQKAAKAEVAAMWAGIKGTRKTKVA